MSPILGIWASSRPAAAADTGAMFPLQVITVGPAGAANVEFTNIPGTYTHLQIRMLTKDTRSAVAINNANATFNSDTSSNYTDHYLLGDGSSAASGGTGNEPIAVFGLSPSGGSSANVYGVAIIDILDYANANKFKTVRSFHGVDSNGSGSVRLRSSVWRSTSAITSIKIAPENSGNFVQYSQFALYGVKTA